MRLLYLSLILISVVTVLSAQYRPSPRREDYDTTEHPESWAPNWMSYVEGHRSVTTLSIPGTHMSMSFNNGAKDQRQSWPLYRQYQAGIRYVDIRIRHFRNNLYIYNGPGSSRYTLDDVFRETIKFLDNYPSEVVLMRIRAEGVATYNRETIGQLLKRMLVRHPSRRVWPSTRTPTMEEARGRIVIIQDFYDHQQFGLQYRYFSAEDSGNPSTVNAIDYKWTRVQHHLDTAIRADHVYHYLTYTAGDGDGVSPYAVANRMNRKLWDFVNLYDGHTVRYGIIAMNFPGSKLVKLIIDTNF